MIDAGQWTPASEIRRSGREGAPAGFIIHHSDFIIDKMDFIGDVIRVETEGEVKRPARFTWRGRAYSIVRILASWHDYSMPAQVRRPRFTMRHHRNYYHVETDIGDRFEIYYDRGAKNPEWVLLKHLGSSHIGDTPPEAKPPC